VRDSAPDEMGPDPYDPAVRRRNVRTFVAVAIALIAVALLPGTVRRVAEPTTVYPTQAEAVEAGAVEAGVVPAFVPPGATRIHTRRNPRTGRHFVRFDYDPARTEELTAGMRPVPEEEKEAVPVPPSGWLRWFPISERTLAGGQAPHLQVFEVPAGRDAGWLALDPRTGHAYYWSPGEGDGGAGSRPPGAQIRSTRGAPGSLLL
jgi:hypothetical protein